MLTCQRCGKVSDSALDFAGEGRSVELVCLACYEPPLTEQIVGADRGGLPFSIGALSLTPLWLLCHGEVTKGLGLIGLNFFFRYMSRESVELAIVAVVASYGISIYFGLKGSRIAAFHHQSRTVEELKRRERGWTIAGVIVLLVIHVPLMYLFLNAIASVRY